MKTIVLIVCIVLTTNGNCAEKIGGIMGLTLSHKFYPPSAKSECIWARTKTNEFPTLEKAKTVLSLLVSKLEEKHGKAVDNYIDRGDQRVSWTVFKQWGTGVNSKGEKEEVVTSAMIVVHCFDRELSAKAAAEREEISGETSIFEYF